MGIGLGVISGTALKLLAPQLANGTSSTTPPGQQPLERLAASQPLPSGMALGRFEPKTELTTLSQKWAQLAARHKDLQASGYLLVLDDGRFAQLQADKALPAASSIKTPILLAGLEELDTGKLRWNEPLTLKKRWWAAAPAGWQANRWAAVFRSGRPPPK